MIRSCHSSCAAGPSVMGRAELARQLCDDILAPFPAVRVTTRLGRGLDPKPTLTAAAHGSLTALTLTAMARLPKLLLRSGEKGDADAAPGAVVRLARVRAAGSVADPHRCGVPRPGAAHRADRRRRPRRRREGSGPLRHRAHLECRRTVRGPRDDLSAGALRRRGAR